MHNHRGVTARALALALALHSQAQRLLARRKDCAVEAKHSHHSGIGSKLCVQGGASIVLGLWLGSKGIRPRLSSTDANGVQLALANRFIGPVPSSPSLASVL